MAVDFHTWSTTAGSNTSINGIDIDEGWAAADINNAIRDMMAQLALVRKLISGSITTGGSANTQTLSSGFSMSSYQQDMPISFEAGFTNTGAATLNIDSIGAKSIVHPDGTALTAGDITAGGAYWVTYEAGDDEFILQGIEGAIKKGTHTIWVPSLAMVSAATNGPSRGSAEASSNAQNYSTLDFDDGTDEYAHFQIAMPKSWNEGTITFRVFWTSTGSDTDGVSWALQGLAAGDGDPIDASWGTAVVVDDAIDSAAGDVLVSGTSAAVTIAGTPAAGDLCFFRLFRDVSDANDTATEDAKLLGVQVFITINASDDA